MKHFHHLKNPLVQRKESFYRDKILEQPPNHFVIGFLEKHH